MTFLIGSTFGQTDRKKVIPFDSTSQKYTYEKIVEIQGKSANDLYDIGKKWLINKFHDDKFLIDEHALKTVDLGNFQISVILDMGSVNLTQNMVVIYDISLFYKESKCKLEITSIKLSGNSQGTTYETTLEAYEKSVENGHRGKKKNMQKYLYDIFIEIDTNLKKTISDFELNIKGENKSKEW
jgi:hypothetical protein